MNDRLTSRRSFLARMGAAAASLLAAYSLWPEPKHLDKDIREADFYSPHDLAG